MSKTDSTLVERIRFPTWNPYLPGDMADPAIREKQIAGEGQLFLPDLTYARPCPAVVIVHGLGGPKKVREFAYARRLVRAGYVVLLINSFRTRRVGFAIQIIRALVVTTAMIMADTFAALKYLSGHPMVDGKRIAVIGFSFGGMISVLTAYRQMKELYLPGGPAFAAHASYYGSSIPRLEDPDTTGAPVLMLLGARDRNVSIPRSEDIANDLRSGGSDVSVRIFDAHHQWDTPQKGADRMIFHLRKCRIRIEKDNTVRDEKTGRTIRGFWSRLWFLLRNSVPSGYVLKHHRSTHRESDALLESFLDLCLAPGAITDQSTASAKTRAGEMATRQQG